jgi:hypothetical protein
MNLEDYERGMLSLIKGRGAPPDHPDLQAVAVSPGLAVTREIALFWRRFGIQTQCRFTYRLLTRLGAFESLIASYFDSNPTSPFVEQLGLSFLRSLEDHEHALVRAVAQFELAVMRVKGDGTGAFEILWDRHPDDVFLALETGGDLPEADAGSLYLLRIAGASGDFITCSRLPRPPAT